MAYSKRNFRKKSLNSKKSLKKRNTKKANRYRRKRTISKQYNKRKIGGMNPSLNEYPLVSVTTNGIKKYYIKLTDRFEGFGKKTTTYTVTYLDLETKKIEETLQDVTKEKGEVSLGRTSIIVKVHDNLNTKIYTIDTTNNSQINCQIRRTMNIFDGCNGA